MGWHIDICPDRARVAGDLNAGGIVDDGVLFPKEMLKAEIDTHNVAQVDRMRYRGPVIGGAGMVIEDVELAVVQRV
jgi:hypothetical protein